MKYAVIIITLYFKDHEKLDQLSLKLKEENGDEKKQVEEFINSYRNVIKYLNIDDFVYLLVDSVEIEYIEKEYQKREILDITKLDV